METVKYIVTLSTRDNVADTYRTRTIEVVDSKHADHEMIEKSVLSRMRSVDRYLTRIIEIKVEKGAKPEPKGLWQI